MNEIDYFNELEDLEKFIEKTKKRYKKLLLVRRKLVKEIIKKYPDLGWSCKKKE